MKKQLFILTFITFSLIGGSVFASHTDDHHNEDHKHNLNSSETSEKVIIVDQELIPSGNQIKFKVDGVVCSFCAYGLEKNLGKLPFAHKKDFGGDGVLVDVKKGIITVSINPKKKIDVEGSLNAITKGGYVAREVHMLASGTPRIINKMTILTDDRYVQTFSLTQKTGKVWKPTSSKRVTLYVMLEVPKKMENIDVLPVIVKSEI